MSFATLEIARNTLNATRLAMDVAAQNVANANTPGYVRQRVLLSPLHNAGAANSRLTGIGVQVAGVQRLRDQCLETQIGHQEGKLGQERALSASLQRVQGVFPDLDGSGLSAALGQTFDALQRLQADPGSLTSRREVLDNAEGFCREMNDAYRQLRQEETVLETDLSQSLDQVNRLLHQVAELNGKIVTGGDGPGANDLRVTREEALRQLSGLCGALGLDQADGSQDVLLGGVRLVQGGAVQELSLVPTPGDPTRSQVAVGDLTALEALGGRLQGDLTARDTHLAAWRGQLDTLARTVAEALNTTHAQGYDLRGQAGGDFLTYDAAHPASTLAVDPDLRADPRRLAAASYADGAVGDGGNAVALAGLRTAKLFSGGTQTAEQYQSALLYEVGAATQRAAAATTAREGLVQSLDTQYANQAGVSLDEEAVDIMRYQQVYNAGARLAQAALEMLDTVLNLAG